MFTKSAYSEDVTANYNMLSKQLDALLTGETNAIANFSNASALLNQFLDKINVSDEKKVYLRELSEVLIDRQG